MIEDHGAIVQPEPRIRLAERIAGRERQSLDGAPQTVPQVADRAAGERHPRRRALQRPRRRERPQKVERIAHGAPFHPLLPRNDPCDGRLAAAQRDDEEGIPCEDRVARFGVPLETAQEQDRMPATADAQERLHRLDEQGERLQNRPRRRGDREERTGHGAASLPTAAAAVAHSRLTRSR